MGVINIVEGVIPLVMNDIVRGVIATAIGGFVGGATTMILGADATVPFGGVLMIPTMSKTAGWHYCNCCKRCGYRFSFSYY